MKFLVLGASGMAGHLISIYLNENGHDVTGYSRRKIDYVNWVYGDIEEKQQLKELIEFEKFDAVINAIGVLNQMAEVNKEKAVFTNSYLPHYLAAITEKMNTQIIHLSTDCVFSGKNAPYTEHSFQNGETFYDRTKALGELYDKKNVTLRNSIIGPDINKNGIGLFNWFMSQKGEVNGYTRVMWTGVTTLELAKVIEMAATERIYGLYNMVPPTNISKYSLLCLFNKYFKSANLSIQPNCEPEMDKTLIRTNFDFSYQIPDYEIMISDLVQWVKEHKEIYPHYQI